MAQQRHGEARRPRRIGRKGARILRSRPPARDGGGAGRRTRFRLLLRLLRRPLGAANAQQKDGHARSLRSAGQTQRRGEVKRARRAENLDQRRAKAFAARRIDAGAQNRLGVPAAHHAQGGGIDAKFGKPHAVQPPGFALDDVLPRPEQGPPRRGAQSQAQTEASGGGPVRVAGCENLMQTGALQPAVQQGVDALDTQREPRGAIRWRHIPAAGPGDERPQSRQGFRTRRRNASVRIDPMHGVLLNCS